MQIFEKKIMLKYAKDGVSVVLTLDTRREKKDGLFPVKIQVVQNGKQKYYSTGKSLSEDEWELLPESKSRKLSEIRKDLENSFSMIKVNVEALVNEHEFTFDVLNLRLGKGLASHTLNAAFQAKIETLLEENRIGSYNYYKDTLKTIEEFAGKQIIFDYVTVDWLKKFEKHLLKKGRNYTTIGMRCRAIRAIMNDALSLGIIKEKQYPFGQGKYEIPTGQGRKLALSLQQIKSLVTYTDGSEATEHYRDLWFFSYLCNGINFADLITLKYSNIHNGEIYFIRTKTIRTSKVKKEICAIVTPEMQAIIDKWGNPDKQQVSYIFGFLKGGETAMQISMRIRDVISCCNKYLRKIGKAIGIEGLSTYTARHSYATVLKRSGANIAYISESLGHNDLKTTENYLASFEKEERIKNAKLLTDFGE
ncbi:Tyrosine recombinase XerC [termite gut metagenome]|uniref:Tyrosine recombinase XerC n=2 Tax=termite gut metagenome TaxID=433724 RepID=A0A5J4QU70_9ZZZZ